MDLLIVMTTDRPYRKVLGIQAALDELWRCAGFHFDTAAKTFIEAYERAEAADGVEAK